MVQAWANANVTWQDNRPAYISDTDTDAATFQVARQWSDGNRTTLHTLGPLPFTYLSSIAYAFMIRSIRSQRVLAAGQSLTRPRARVPESDWTRASSVLEAIGLRYLTPTVLLPLRTPDLYDYRPGTINSDRTYIGA